MIRTYAALSLPAACLFLFGCIAQPQMADLPLMRERNELKADAGVSLNSSVQATATYSVTSNIAVQAYGDKRNSGSAYLQGAVGYFRNFSEKGSWELYAGYGQGYWQISEHICEPNAVEKSYQQGYQLSYLQYNIGRSGMAFANADFAFGIKASYLWAGIKDNGSEPYNRQYLLGEPLAMLRLGGKRLKFTTKIGFGWAFPLAGSFRLNYAPFNAGLGASYRIGGK